MRISKRSSGEGQYKAWINTDSGEVYSWQRRNSIRKRIATLSPREAVKKSKWIEDIENWTEDDFLKRANSDKYVSSSEFGIFFRAHPELLEKYMGWIAEKSKESKSIISDVFRGMGKAATKLGRPVLSDEKIEQYKDVINNTAWIALVDYDKEILFRFRDDIPKDHWEYNILNKEHLLIEVIKKDPAFLVEKMQDMKGYYLSDVLKTMVRLWEKGEVDKEFVTKMLDSFSTRLDAGQINELIQKAPFLLDKNTMLKHNKKLSPSNISMAIEKQYLNWDMVKSMFGLLSWGGTIDYKRWAAIFTQNPTVAERLLFISDEDFEEIKETLGPNTNAEYVVDNLIEKLISICRIPAMSLNGHEDDIEPEEWVTLAKNNPAILDYFHESFNLKTWAHFAYSGALKPEVIEKYETVFMRMPIIFKFLIERNPEAYLNKYYKYLYKEHWEDWVKNNKALINNAYYSYAADPGIMDRMEKLNVVPPERPELSDSEECPECGSSDISQRPSNNWQQMSSTGDFWHCRDCGNDWI